MWVEESIIVSYPRLKLLGFLSCDSLFPCNAGLLSTDASVSSRGPQLQPRAGKDRLKPALHRRKTAPSKTRTPSKNHDTGSTDAPSSEDDEERPLNQEGREMTDRPANDTKSNVTEPDFACSRSNSRSSQTRPGRAKPRNACENRILVPSVRILHAAFTSRSITQPHTGHEYTRSDNVSLSEPRKR